MCKCITTMDALLADRNTKLSVAFVVRNNVLEASPVIATEQVETGRGKKKAQTMLPRFCPFCGTLYPRHPAEAAA